MGEEKEKEELKKKVMVIIDESERSYQSLMWVLNNLKESLKTTQLVLFSPQPPPICNNSWGAQLGFTRFYCPFSTNIISIIEENKKVSIGLLEKAKGICTNAGVHVVTLTEAGDPKESTLSVIQRHKINLLVIGNDNYNGILKRISQGSLSNYFLDNASCPVLVVKN